MDSSIRIKAFHQILKKITQQRQGNSGCMQVCGWKSSPIGFYVNFADRKSSPLLLLIQVQKQLYHKTLYVKTCEVFSAFSVFVMISLFRLYKHITMKQFMKIKSGFKMLQMIQQQTNDNQDVFCFNKDQLFLWGTELYTTVLGSK